MVSSARSVTLKAFLERLEIETSPAWEYIDGKAVQKPIPQIHHSRLQLKLASTIESADDQLVASFPELRCTFGERSVVPDIVVLTWQNIPLTVSGELEDGAISFAPDWVIEILSPDQKQIKVIENVLHCLTHGSRLGWLLDPEERAIVVFQPQQEPKIYRNDQSPVVLAELDLNLTAAQIFSWLNMKRST
ncbi:MAG: Uma2 family endonuclease [Cyanobacteria bacterium P01_A01_bin.17]